MKRNLGKITLTSDHEQPGCATIPSGSVARILAKAPDGTELLIVFPKKTIPGGEFKDGHIRVVHLPTKHVVEFN